MTMRSPFFVFGSSLALLGLAACSEIPAGAYYNRGDPENLIDVSSEVETIGLASSADLAQLDSTLDQDPPARAELHCDRTDPLCKEAAQALKSRGIPARWMGGHDGVALLYQRIVARDCENRYIDNSINPYNLEPPTFGCSLMANTVQMVSDRNQFVNPHLLDFTDGEKAVQAYQSYMRPPTPVEQQTLSVPVVSSQTVGQ